MQMKSNCTKFIVLFLLFVSIVFVCGWGFRCRKKDALLLFNSQPITNQTINNAGRHFKAGEKVYYIRPYVFFNQDLSIVDTRLFYNDIIKAKEELSNKRYYNSYLEKRYKGHIFRQNPVPYTGKRRANSCRNVKYGRIIRDLRNPENKDFIRKKRYYDILEPYFDLPYKKETKSWKEQTKRRHQWEKHG